MALTLDNPEFSGGDYIVKTALSLGVVQGTDALFQTTIGFIVALGQLTGQSEAQVCGVIAAACEEAAAEYDDEYVEKLKRDLGAMEMEVREHVESAGIDTRAVLPEWLTEAE